MSDGWTRRERERKLGIVNRETYADDTTVLNVFLQVFIILGVRKGGDRVEAHVEVGRCNLYEMREKVNG